jgi:hypothetical protein
VQGGHDSTDVHLIRADVRSRRRPIRPHIGEHPAQALDDVRLEVGRVALAHSADTLKKLSLELGGNAPFIVFDDADVDAAVDGLMAGKFRNGGQTCVSPNRVFVQAGVHDLFVEKLAARIAALKVGPASDEGSQIGPMINTRAVDKIERHVRDAVARGARVAVGGRRLQALGPNYFAPTLLTDADATMACACEETFGPLVPLTHFETEAEVITAANATPFGLAAYFYSNDVRRIWRVAETLETGIVGINEGALAAEAAPSGGVKESGYGREGSVHGLGEYMHLKYLCQGQLWPLDHLDPYNDARAAKTQLCGPHRVEHCTLSLKRQRDPLPRGPRRLRRESGSPCPPPESTTCRSQSCSRTPASSTVMRPTVPKASTSSSPTG